MKQKTKNKKPRIRILDGGAGEINDEIFPDIVLKDGTELDITTLTYNGMVADRKSFKECFDDGKHYDGDIAMIMLWNTISRDYILIKKDDVRKLKSEDMQLVDKYYKSCKEKFDSSMAEFIIDDIEKAFNFLVANRDKLNETQARMVKEWWELYQERRGESYPDIKWECDEQEYSKAKHNPR